MSSSSTLTIASGGSSRSPDPDEIRSPWVNSGVMVLDRALLARIPAGRFSDFGREVLPEWSRERRAAGLRLAAAGRGTSPDRRGHRRSSYGPGRSAEWRAVRGGRRPTATAGAVDGSGVAAVRCRSVSARVVVTGRRLHRQRRHRVPLRRRARGRGVGQPRQRAPRRGRPAGPLRAAGPARPGGRPDRDARRRAPDAVVHLAAEALVDVSLRDPGRFYRANLVGGINLLDAMVEAGATRLVFSSTASIYGQPERSPITEETAGDPVNSYGESKWAFERALRWYETAHGLRHVSFRYFNACGATARTARTIAQRRTSSRGCSRPRRADGGVPAVRHGPRDARRHLRPGLRARRGHRRRPRAGAREGRRAALGRVQPRPRPRILQPRGHRGGGAGDWAPGRHRAGPAAPGGPRHDWWPTRRRAGDCSAGRRGSPTWTPWSRPPGTGSKPTRRATRS